MNDEHAILLWTLVISVPFLTALIRLVVILPAASAPTKEISNTKLSLDPARKGANFMIFLGSGGHTGEMMRLISTLDLNPFSRTWIVSTGDNSSIVKAKQFEDEKLSGSEFQPKYLLIARARKVGQPLLLSIFTTIKSFISTVVSLFRLPQYPSILLLNGPGTSVPIGYTIFFMKYFGFCNTKIIYVESLARVNSLSLSGILLLPISDRLIVQWEKLSKKYKRAEYYGILV